VTWFVLGLVVVGLKSTPKDLDSDHKDSDLDLDRKNSHSHMDSTLVDLTTSLLSLQPIILNGLILLYIYFKVLSNNCFGHLFEMCASD